MIIFHEGMPRSGKSYSAIKDHLLPALAKGRKCYVRIDGLDHAKIAGLAGRTLDEIGELLVDLSEEQVRRFTQQDFAQDSFIIVDEAQNYWPMKRQPLEAELAKWIAEHGHHGHDVLLMGQLAKDVHKTWINRVNRKVQFIKKDVVGKENEYKWIMFHGAPDANGNVKFREVSKGDALYEEHYFGTYKSHSDGTDNKDNYRDDRANLFKTAAFRKWLPLYGVVALLALGFVIHTFRGGMLKEEPKPPAKSQETQAVKRIVPEKPKEAEPPPAKPAPAAAAPIQSPGPDKKLPGQTPEILPASEAQAAPPPDYIEQLTTTYRIRLAGYLRGRGGTLGTLEWRDEGGGIKEALSFRDVAGLGWLLMVSPEGTVGALQKGHRRYIVTAWPLQDEYGTVSEARSERIRAAGGPPARSETRTVAPRPVASPEPDTSPNFVGAIPPDTPMSLSPYAPHSTGTAAGPSTNPRLNPAMRRPG
jgi:zona occludens toxin